MDIVFIPVIVMISGFALMIIGAEGLVRGSASLALRLGLPPLFIGLTIVSFGTSSPELVVSIGSALQGKGDISVGNVVGSNIFNIAAILGITAMVMPIRVVLPLIKIDIPVMIAVTIAAVFLGRQEISRFSGGVLVVILIAYFILTLKLSGNKNNEAIPAQAEQLSITAHTWWKDLIFICAGIAMLVSGSKIMVDSATEIAFLLGISSAVISLTIVAAGTSMPELATSVVAALRKQPDMAIGNVVGSNILNILGILGISALITPLSAPGVQMVDFAVMMIFTVLLLPLAVTNMTLHRWEGGILFLGYLLYVWWLWPKDQVLSIAQTLT